MWYTIYDYVYVFFFFSWQEWYTVYDQYRRTNCVVSDLIMGNEYVFRVYAINMVGLSPEPCLSKDSAYIQKTGDHLCPDTLDSHAFSLVCSVDSKNTFARN